MLVSVGVEIVRSYWVTVVKVKSLTVVFLRVVLDTLVSYLIWFSGLNIDTLAVRSLAGNCQESNG